MANNELDEILAEIRKKAQETETASAKPQEPEIPVEIVENEPVQSDYLKQHSADDIFGDILKAVNELEEKKKAEASEADVETEEAETPQRAEEDIFTIVEDGIAEEPVVAAEKSTAEEIPAEPEKIAIDEDVFDLLAGKPVRAGEEETAEEEPENKKDVKKPLIIALVCLIIIAALVGVYFGFFHNRDKQPEPETESQPAVSEVITVPPVTEEDGGILNPLTGESGFNEAAVGKRPVAVVVENEYSTASVRPQWGMEEADMIMEGETEYSTRMLFFWADYTNLPDQIGPTRSARPPFIRFSQLFDSIFIHAGLSHSKGNYVGADDVFVSENVDHINLLNLEENGTYFGRNYNRTSTVEHTGYLNGKNAAQLIANQKLRTDANANRFTQFEFNKTAQAMGTEEAKIVRFTWSNACPKHAKFTYIENEGIYRTADFDSRFGEADLQFETILLLLDQTEYIVKENYKGSGNSETYCDYKLSGGKGMIASEGAAMEITWDIENNKLVLKDSEGNPVKLNPGKIYIGYGSSNHGGSYTAEAKTATETDNN